MGTEIINGGEGPKIGAKVNQKHELEVRATQHTEEHFVSLDDGEAFFASTAQTSTKTLTFLTTEVGDAIHLKNVGTKNLVVQAIILNADAPGGVASIIKNKVDAALTQNTLVVANNLNFGSAKISTTEVNVWDETNGNARATGGDANSR